MLFLFLQKLCHIKGSIVQRPKLKHLAFALCLAFLPSSVLAAGLGKLNVMSGLGEPLKADIELLSVTPEELSSINASIASNEAYANQGIDKPASHNDIKIQVTKNARGVPILKLNSAQPITEAFLDMLIQVDWSSGRLLREYTLLLDPPGYNAEAQSSVASLPSSSSNPSAALSDTTTKLVQGNAKAGVTPVSKAKKISEPQPEKIQVNDATASQAPLAQDYTTSKGDTLAKIAQEMKPEGVSLEQMLVGLYQANPQAFDGNNMNRLKVGQIIRAPSPEVLEATGKKAATKEVRVHSANWNEYKNKLAGIVADSQGSDDIQPSQSSSGKVMKAEDKATPPAVGPKDVVKLSGAEASKGTGDKALLDKLTALQEETIAKDNALKESQSRAAELEKQIEDMKKLMALKNDAMAKLQGDAVAQTSPEQANLPPQAEVTQEQQNAPVSPVTQTAPPMEAAPPISEPAPMANKPLVTPPPAPISIEQPGVLEGVAENIDLNTLGFAGGGLALLGGVWLYLRNKRKKNLTSFEEGIMTSGGLKANTVFGNTAGGTVDTGDTSFLTDFSQSTSGGMIDSHDVDPIAEAEVYMAYGRDAQAEEILKDAIVKEPKRYELHLKLLEIYQASGNTSAFEAISGELYTSLGAADPVWAKVAQLGVKMDPDNPLYKVEALPQDSAEVEFSSQDEVMNKTEDDFYASFGSGDETESTTSSQNLSDEQVGLDSDNTTISNVSDSSPFDLDLGALDFDVDTSEQQQANELLGIDSESAANAGFMVDDLSANMDSNEPLLESSSPESVELAEAENDELSLADTGAMFESAPKALDVPTIDFPNLQSADDAVTDAMASAESMLVEQSSAVEDLELNTDNIDVDSFGSEPIDAESIDVESPISVALEEFNLGVEYKIPLGEPSELALSMTEVPSFDLSDINLDLNDISVDTNTSQVAVVSGEPEEVETKLDLVMAYLDMEDKIGARELLEEVLKEGGENQRKRATELMNKIG